jgi:hypothetical protein
MKTKLTMCALAFTFLLAGAAFAQAPANKPAKHAKAATAMHTHVASGTVVSADESKLVLSHKVKGKTQEMSFSLSADTQKTGDLKAGAKATVHYRTENGENVATAVNAKS